MAEYKNYLAARILSEEQVLTYRLLSRALKIHVNAAKEMLFEFHRQQNGKKPGSVHATYVIAGRKRIEESIPTNGKADGEDDYMQSSPFISSSMPQPEDEAGESGVLSITLTREEDLDVIRSQYESIASIHIYSLGPHPLMDLQIITDIDREMQSLTANEDPLLLAPKYGTITNPNVRRRTVRRPPPPMAPAPAIPSKPTVAPKSKLNEVQTASDAPKPTATKTETKSSAKDFFGKARGSTNAKLKRESSGASSSKESTPAPSGKNDPSSIFRAFAKAKPKESKATDSEREVEKEKVKEDEMMKDVDDDEEEEDTYVPPPQPGKEIVDSDRKKRKDREEALKKMMDDDEEEEEEGTHAHTPKPEIEPEEEEAEKEAEKEAEEPAPVGRRRGRRRVMKKKTVKDEAGYLVTEQEPAWESYSEDEPAAPVNKPKAIPTAKPATNTAAGKAKKGAAGKQGQGNIMSFFGKK